MFLLLRIRILPIEPIRKAKHSLGPVSDTYVCADAARDVAGTVGAQPQPQTQTPANLGDASDRGPCAR